MAAKALDSLKSLLLDPKAVAILCRQPLESVEGPGGVVFPPTYPGKSRDDGPEYNISTFNDGKNVCTIDSVQSQANRIEAAFLDEPYRSLVRRVTVRAKLAEGAEKVIDVLEAPHRLADATIRFSDLREQAEEAFRAFRNDPAKVALLSPMSLLMGAWDSRGTQCKIPRALTARIDAFNVRCLQRRALYLATLTSKELGHEEEKLSGIGLDNAPSGPSPAGVIADGGIYRESVFNLVALRQNCRITYPPAAGDTLSPYIFGLGLVALTLQPEEFLRQGCLLVAGGPVEASVRLSDGSRQTLDLSSDIALAYAQNAAAAFGVPSLAPLHGQFQPELIDEHNKKAKARKNKEQNVA
ncbi:MAG: CRISPR-associated protein, family [Rhodocyclaceae bacterium]|nr:CRISPR-associated protein, family [Rhodocyclaceae bacterium]